MQWGQDNERRASNGVGFSRVNVFSDLAYRVVCAAVCTGCYGFTVVGTIHELSVYDDKAITHHT